MDPSIGATGSRNPYGFTSNARQRFFENILDSRGTTLRLKAMKRRS
jgi:hypothetical protein